MPPIKKKKPLKNRISAPIVEETHCVDSRHFSCKLLKSSGCNLQCNRRRADKSVCDENNKSRNIKKNEISSSNFRMCCSTNARSIVCHLHFTKWVCSFLFSHATMLQEPSVIQMKHFQHYHPKHENLTIYSTNSQAGTMLNSELVCQVR